MVAFAILIYLFLGSVEGFSTKSQPCTYSKDKTCKPALANAIFNTVSFLLGAITFVVSGFLGIKIATNANARTTLEAKKGVGKAVITTFHSGAVMGFLLVANGLLVLYIAINLFKLYYGQDWEGLFEAIIGYGLGGSSMTLSERVGRIYTKATDVGTDLVGKVDRNIPEDDRKNPVVIADNVGDNVGDIAAMLYPLLISSMCIIVCLITTLFATDFFEIKAVKEIQPAFIISIVLMTLGIGLVSWIALPSTFTIFNFGVQKTVKNWELFFCVAIGLWAGLVIGFVTEYYTSNAYSPVQDVADSCKTRTTTNVIFGLALGYKSVIISIFAIAISDKAGGISGMAGMSHRIRERTDALDAAGNTNAAIGKGFAIGSAALVSLALFGTFVSRVSISTIGDKLKLQFAHMNLEDKVRFEGAGSDRMWELWHSGWRTYSKHPCIVRS